MRKVVDGKLYDTETAELVASRTYEPDVGGHRFTDSLYRTKKETGFS